MVWVMEVVMVMMVVMVEPQTDFLEEEGLLTVAADGQEESDTVEQGQEQEQEQEQEEEQQDSGLLKVSLAMVEEQPIAVEG